MKIAIGIATCGRAALLDLVIKRFELQSRKADAIFICPTCDDDVRNTQFDDQYIIRVHSGKGAAKQRNAIFEKAKDYDLIVFFDDDFITHREYIKNIEDEFINHPRTVIATGNVIDDGVNNAGIELIQAALHMDGFSIKEHVREQVFSVYGCNMAMRTATIMKYNLRFDEDFPLYSWLEDLDLSRQIIQYGDCIKISNAAGVHLGCKIGRTSGLRYGYSQIANPFHIAKKRNGFTYMMAINMSFRNVVANLTKSLYSEPYIDRSGRLKGNMIAITDLCMGRLDSNKIKEFK